MFKISFKNDFKDTLVFQNKVTVVTLTGNMIVELENIPRNIWTWALEHPSIDVSVTYNSDSENWILKSSGKAKCHPNDTPNPVIGERIAESRAKIRLYKFMRTLTQKLLNYYESTIGCKYIKADYSIPNGLYSINYKYYTFLEKEREHLKKLLNKNEQV